MTTTVVTRVRDRAAPTPDGVAMRHKDLGIWQRDHLGGVLGPIARRPRHALLALGVQPGDRVSIQSENRPEWLVLDLATVAVRAHHRRALPDQPRRPR